MKTARINLIAIVSVLTLALSATVPLALAAENAANQPISKKELKHLLQTAKEPAEHLRIAEYYRQEAQRLIAESKYHEDMGQLYKNQPLSFEAKHPYGTIGLSHCHYWAQLDAQEAKEAEALASLHEKMAKAAEKKQQ